MVGSINVQTLAEFSRIAYTENFKLMKAKALAQDPNWWLAATSVETEGAYDMHYHSFAMVNEATKEILIVNSGTRLHHVDKFQNLGFLNDVVANIGVLNKSTPQAFIDDGEKFINTLVQKFPGYSFINTGHSLGAVYAQLSHAYLISKGVDSYSVVFESPGASEIIGHYLTEHLKTSNQNKERIINTVKNNSYIYNVEDSLIGTLLNKQLGTLYLLADDSIPIASTLGSIAGIKGADQIFKLADSLLSANDKHGIDFIITKLRAQEVELAPCTYDASKNDDLVGEAIGKFASLFDL
jgi:hypothetical protein